MKIMKSSGFAGSLLLVGALMFSGGCGYKNAPVPPQTVVPKVIEDLRYNVGDAAVALTWSYPTETVGGKNITDIKSFELFRAEVPLADVCNGCPIPFGEPIELPGGVTTDDKVRIAEYESGLLRSGYKYFFKIRSRTSWWASSDDSNIVTFVYYTLAAAPEGVQARSGDNRISLKWDPVTELIDGKPADLQLRYQVMKSTDGKEFAAAGKPVSVTTYEDTQVETGKKYYYRIKSNMLLEDNLVQGSLSDSVSVMVADMTPPAMVTGVTVVSSAKNNRIFWDRVKDQGLAGYKIYRRAENEKKATYIGKATATQTIFVDDNVPKETRLYYSVTAIDNAKPANESKRSKEVTTRH